VELGRFHSSTHPLVIGGRAGILALLALLFYSLERRRNMLAVAVGCAVVIALAGAKTAFLAAALCIGLLFSLRRRVMAAFGLLLALGLLAFIIVSTTAVGGYIAEYLHSGDIMTISGRTDLWSAAWPEITSHLALGHGYVASKLVSLEVGIPWYAGHLHNAILETLYNNGLPGLALLLAINIIIVADLFSLYRHAHRHEVQLVSMCLLAVYAFLFLNGLTEPYFGGEASAFYLLFLALFGISEWLRRYSEAISRQEIPSTVRTTPLPVPVYRAS
jgi:O-antigen ligase